VPSDADAKAPSFKEGKQQPLLTPFKFFGHELSTRMVYAPLTRCRALGTIPQPAAAEYYSQRAFKGSFQLSEGTVVSPHGHGYPNTPGINTQEHVEAWKPIVQAVHDKGGVFFLQLWHVGRVSHTSYMPDDQGPVGPSPIAIDGDIPLADGSKARFSVPRELKTEELPQIVDQFVVGARNSLAAGFDGVEIHGAHGYLLEEFLKKSTNQRTDQYGGSVENRCRLVLEVVDAVIKEVGPGKAGIRLSPFTKFMDSHTDDPYDVYGYLVEQLNSRDLAYVHFVEPRINEYMGGGLAKDTDSIAPFRKAWKGVFLAAGGYDRETGNKAVAEGHADLIVYGRHWIANPDLPERFRLEAPLNKYDRSTFYTSDQKVGYTDYPFLDEKLASELAAKANL
jgi:12-oxophytodienoic acid reductase